MVNCYFVIDKTHANYDAFVALCVTEHAITWPNNGLSQVPSDDDTKELIKVDSTTQGWSEAREVDDCVLDYQGDVGHSVIMTWIQDNITQEV